jgi:hypothetical protein
LSAPLEELVVDVDFDEPSFHGPDTVKVPPQSPPVALIVTALLEVTADGALMLPEAKAVPVPSITTPPPTRPNTVTARARAHRPV